MSDAVPPEPAARADRVDGRRERSRSSRAKIVAAMLDLVRRGDVSPSAARVADEAGVGLRTVFRHFDDMDSLYREMSEVIEARVRPLMAEQYGAPDWRGRLAELVERRMRVFDEILPFRISANIKRFHSAFLLQDYRRLLTAERQVVEAILPPPVMADRLGVEALHVALSFQGWRLLRHDLELPAERAREIVRRLVADVVANLPDA